MTFIVKLGDAIASRRQALGITQDELAKSCDLSRTHISEIERGNANPSVSVLYRIAKILHVPLSRLVKLAES